MNDDSRILLNIDIVDIADLVAIARAFLDVDPFTRIDDDWQVCEFCGAKSALSPHVVARNEQHTWLCPYQVDARLFERWGYPPTKS